MNNWEDRTEDDKVNCYFNGAYGAIKYGMWLLFIIGIVSSA